MTWKTAPQVLAAALLLPSLALGRIDPEDQDVLRQLGAQRSALGRTARPAAQPDIFGPGAVLNVGNVAMKVTNLGIIGNSLRSLSNDPSGQWPGLSGVEYLNFIVLAVGAVNPFANDPTAVRRVSTVGGGGGFDWWPASPEPEDRMYRAYDGIVSGARLTNDDSDANILTGDPSVDEDFLDGRDNDGDGRIDEDYAALGQLMYSCVMRDDTEAARTFVSNERHVPLVLECRQLAWAYSVPGFQDFNVVQWDVYNRSGHMLDSMYVGARVDMDAGPFETSAYFADDFDLPDFPHGAFKLPVRGSLCPNVIGPNDARFQEITDPPDTLCPEMTVRVQGFSVADNDGDEGRTPGVASFLLFGHTVDPLGLRAPRGVGFRHYRSYVLGTPYANGGNAILDQQRFELMNSTDHIDQETGFIVHERGDQPGNYQAWCSTGPYLNVPDGGMVTLTIGFAVAPGLLRDLDDYAGDYRRFEAGVLPATDLCEKYPALENALTAQIAYEGVYELPRPGFTDQVPDCPGCETGLKLPKGGTPTLVAEVCPDREGVQKLVTDNAYTWFDFDCDPCTGVFDNGLGYYLRHWNAESPPPNPNMNVASLHNYTDNPSRVLPSGDDAITLAWDNISETTPDPKEGTFDFRTYRVWKVAGWRRPVGAAGPNDVDWALMSELRMFDYADSNFSRDAANDTMICPKVLVPNYVYPAGHPHCSDPFGGATQLNGGGCRDTATVGICLRKGDFWDRQSGTIARPQDMECIREAVPPFACKEDSGKSIFDRRITIYRTRYPIGRYMIVDPEVKNGFVYFYSVTAGDSTGDTELHGRRAGVEADFVTPQAPTKQGKNVWVVPNPYRGYRNILERPSAWDLTPNATDPTGTHIDFMGLPAGKWRIRIYTVSGDLVAEIHDDDPVNESLRGAVTDEQGKVRPGFNRQQDHAADGQARWNLITRNGQDVVSGIYLFVVESDQGQQRGKFVVVR